MSNFFFQSWLILFIVIGLNACRKPEQNEAAKSIAQTVTKTDQAPCTPASPCLSIVIDDWGRDLEQLRKFLLIDGELTFALLPQAIHSPQSYELILAAKKELLLHLPMMPLQADKISDEKLVLSKGQNIANIMQGLLKQYPNISGISNHMGSAFSRDTEAVSELMKSLKGTGLFFLDSKTSPETQFCQVAKLPNVSCLTRDFFLDDQPEKNLIASQVSALFNLARQRGFAIAIGHPFDETLEVLNNQLKGSNFRLVPVSHLLMNTKAH